MLCPRCKTENDDFRIRCGNCGQNISKRGGYSEQQGPRVVVLGSVEDLKRAREQGGIDESEDDANALGWLNSDEIEELPPAPEGEAPKTRRVSVREIDKISGLRDLRSIQAALLEGETETRPAEVTPPPPARDTRRASPVGRTSAPPPEPPPRSAPPPPAAPADADDLPVAPQGPAAAWLANELFPQPFALELGRRYLAGRDPRASIFLPSSQVSRRHAGIAADEKGEFWVEDLHSSNGTYVNGRAILKRRLREGDRVDVGPFSLTFVKASADGLVPDASCDPNEETRTLHALPGSLSGEIDKNRVGPVLALLNAGKRSGVLTLRAGRQVGRIFVIDGEVHHAQLGKVVGEEALAALVPAEGGVLHFSDEKIQVKRSIQRPLDELLA